jgi:hypothetical protein
LVQSLKDLQSLAKLGNLDPPKVVFRQESALFACLDRQGSNPSKAGVLPEEHVPRAASVGVPIPGPICFLGLVPHYGVASP